MAGFFSKKRYAAMVEGRSAMKLCPYFRREHEIEDLTLVVDNKLKLISEEPSYGAFLT